jgi:1-deoxy-D-xylulose-5-phosphate synthase
MYTIRLTTNWYGMWATRHMDIKYLPAAGIILSYQPQIQGLSGFPKRSESVYDTFGVGHSSTSISAALGMAMAAKYKGENKKISCSDRRWLHDGRYGIRSDEPCGCCDSDVLIILNDNCMSIDPNVGALKEYLTDISTSPTYNKVRDEIWNLMGKLPVGKNFTAIWPANWKPV